MDGGLREGGIEDRSYCAYGDNYVTPDVPQSKAGVNGVTILG